MCICLRLNNKAIMLIWFVFNICVVINMRTELYVCEINCNTF